ncbi:MAG: hypothetical protein RBT59_02885 [Arcobacteraceae bacterium]|jgi:hypothetical protein|nr:hypothetical protein [Arcobacteraceae bacterium]
MTCKGVSITKTLYIATVTNDGNYRAYINEIYGIAEDAKQHYAHLKIQQGISNNEFLKKLSSEHKEYIEPKSTNDYNIYFSKDSQSFILKKCIVVDGSGKKWSSSSHFPSGNADK